MSKSVVLAAAKACDCSLFIYHPDKRRRADYGTNSDVNLWSRGLYI